MGQSEMDNPEKLTTQGTQDDEKQNKNTTETPLCANRHKLFQQDMNVSTNNWR